MAIIKITAVIFAAFLLFSLAMWGGIGAANFAASFAAFSLVAVSSFLGYKKVVSDAAARKEGGAEPPAETDDEEEDEEGQKPSKFALVTQSYKGLLFPLRLVSYVVFIATFFAFNNNDALNVFAFLCGIAVLPIAALSFALFFRREF